nr:MAG TPA: hypothetical protein [Caudoviricetes sp.]
MEIRGLQLAIPIGKLVTQILHGVCVDQGTSGFTFCMDCSSDFTGVLVVLSTNSIDVAICFAAAILHLRTQCLHLQSIVITTLCNFLTKSALTGRQITQHCICGLVVKACLKLSLSKAIATAEAEAIATPSQQEEQEEHPDPSAIATEHAVIVTTLKSDHVGGTHAARTFHTHENTSFIELCICKAPIVRLPCVVHHTLKLLFHCLKINSALLAEIASNLLKLLFRLSLCHLLCSLEERVVLKHTLHHLLRILHVTHHLHCLHHWILTVSWVEHLHWIEH